MISSFMVREKINQYAFSNLYEKLLYLMIITSPISVYGILFFGISLRLSRLCLLFLVPLLILKLIRKPNLIFRDNFFMYGFLPYIIFASFSILWAPVEVRDFSFNRIGALFEIAIIYVSFLAADLNFVKFLKAIKVYFASAFIPMLFAIWQIANNIYSFSKAQLPFQDLFIPGKYEIYKDRSTYFLDGGYSRISSTLAEPTIFGSFLSSVFLLSLLIDPSKKLNRLILRIFQFIILCCIFLSLSKMAIAMLFIGLVVIFRTNKKARLSAIAGIVIFFLILFDSFPFLKINDFIFRRLFTDSGHLNLLIETFKQLRNINLFIGEGIGSIPNFTTNKFMLSRIYETGFVGLVFSIQVSLLPLIIIRQRENNLKSALVKDIILGTLIAIIIGLHLYDSFIYIWPWIVIGLIMSFLNNLRSS